MSEELLEKRKQALAKGRETQAKQRKQREQKKEEEFEMETVELESKERPKRSKKTEENSSYFGKVFILGELIVGLGFLVYGLVNCDWSPASTKESEIKVSREPATEVVEKQEKGQLSRRDIFK